MSDGSVSRPLYMFSVAILGAIALVAVLGVVQLRRDVNALKAEVAATAKAAPASSAGIRYDTPVYHEWKDADGKVVGSYTQPLYEYTHADKQEVTQSNDLREIKFLIHLIVSDPEKRAILVRHDMTEAELDALARKFADSR